MLSTTIGLGVEPSEALNKASFKQNTQKTVFLLDLVSVVRNTESINGERCHIKYLVPQPSFDGFAWFALWRVFPW